MVISPRKRTNWGDIHVASRLRIARTERGYSQTKMAEALGVTVGQYQKYETCHNRLTPQRIFDACTFLKIKPTYLFDGAGEKDRGSAIEPELFKRMEVQDFELLRSILRLGPGAKRALRHVAEELAKKIK